MYVCVCVCVCVCVFIHTHTHKLTAAQTWNLNTHDFPFTRILRGFIHAQPEELACCRKVTPSFEREARGLGVGVGGWGGLNCQQQSVTFR